MYNKKDTPYKNTLRRTEIIVFLLYVCCVMAIVGYHEAWRDEAQAWLLSRDMTIYQLIDHISYEGTPALWHLTIMPFAKMGVSYAAMKYINITIISIAAYLFLRFSPFSLRTKVLFIFSYYMAWEYSIIARSYSISIAAIFSIAALYQYRFTRPVIFSFLVAILFNTNVHSFMLASGIGGIYLYELKENKRPGREALMAIFIIAMGAFLALFQLFPYPDNMYHWRVNTFAPFISVMNAFFPVTSYLEEQLTHKLYLTPLAFIALMTLLYFVFFLYANYRKLFFLYVFVAIGLLSIFLFKNFGTYRHHGFIFISLIFVLWISENYQHKTKQEYSGLKKYFPSLAVKFEKDEAARLLNIVLGFSLLGGGVMYYKEYTSAFSGSQTMAQYVINHDLEERQIVASSSQIMSSMLPYLPKTVPWYPDTRRFGTYIIWTNEYKNNRNLTFEEIEKRAKKADVLDESTLFLLSTPMPDSQLTHYQLLMKSDVGIFGALDEKYYLYQSK